MTELYNGLPKDLKYMVNDYAKDVKLYKSMKDEYYVKLANNILIPQYGKQQTIIKPSLFTKGCNVNGYRFHGRLMHKNRNKINIFDLRTMINDSLNILRYKVLQYYDNDYDEDNEDNDDDDIYEKKYIYNWLVHTVNKDDHDLMNDDIIY